MACNPDFVQFIIDQCSGAGEIADVEARDYLASLIRATLPALPKPKAKRI